MSDNNISRQPKGRPTGGQFAATAKSSSDLDSLAGAETGAAPADGLISADAYSEVWAARIEPVCSHGHTGYCEDDALPGERRAMNFLHRHAYDYATAVGVERDEAEEYAAWSAALHWRPGEVTISGSHRSDFEEFRRERSSGRG